MRRTIVSVALLAVFATVPADAQILRTMPRGAYDCALPGSASGEAWISQDNESFVISRASRYRTSSGRGTYVVKGDVLTFTAGPKNGQRLRRTGPNELRSINADGSTGRLICVRSS